MGAVMILNGTVYLFTTLQDWHNERKEGTITQQNPREEERAFLPGNQGPNSI